MTYNLSKNPAGLMLDSEAEVKHEGQRRFDVADPGIRGFSRFPNKAKPIFRPMKKEGRKPVALEQFAA